MKFFSKKIIFTIIALFSLLVILIGLFFLNQKEIITISIPGEDDIEIGIGKDSGNPYAKINKWKGDASFYIEYAGEEGIFEISKEEEIIKAKNGNKEVHFYRVGNSEKKDNLVEPNIFGFFRKLIGTSKTLASENEKVLRYFNFGAIDLYSMNAYYEIFQHKDDYSPTITLYTSNEDGYQFYGTRETERDLRFEDVDLPIGRYATMEKGDGSPVVFVNKEGIISITLYNKEISKDPEKYMDIVTDAYDEVLKDYGIDNVKSFSNTMYYLDGIKPKIVGRKSVDGDYIHFAFYLDSPLKDDRFLKATRDYLKAFEVIVSLDGLRSINKNIDYSFGEKIVEKIAEKTDLELLKDSLTIEETEIVNSLKEELDSKEWIKYSERKDLVQKQRMEDVEKFEIELVLREKPSTNLFEYKIESENLLFWYQGELTKEETEEGFHRPEDIIGSYAVYHKDHEKTRSKEEAEIYGIGKAFHIYRPKIVDALGKEVWGELNIDEEREILSVKVSQEFLDNAIYPVKVDPTFGFTSKGSSDRNIGGSIMGSFFQSPSSAQTGISVHTHIRRDKSGNFKIRSGVYDSDYNFLTNGATGEYLSNWEPDTENWITLNFLSAPSFLASTNYLIVSMGDVSNTHIAYDTVSESIGRTKAVTYGSFPSTLTDYNSDTFKYSIYITSEEVVQEQLSTPQSLSNTSITTSGFTANWNSVANADGYTVEVHSNDTYSNLVQSQTPSETSQSFSGLDDDTTYYWRVKATASGYTDSEWANSSVTTDAEVAGGGYLSSVVAIFSKGIHSMALKSDGTVVSWGYNTYGQLGDGTTTDRSIPVKVKGPGGTGYLSNIIGISIGAGYHSLALKNDNTVWTWGDNTDSQLGDGTSSSSLTPVRICDFVPGEEDPPSAGGNAVQVAVGFHHSLALKEDGTVFAWGSNIRGQLGNNTTVTSYSPVQVVGPGGVNYLTGVATSTKSIDGGAHHSLALKSDGTVWAWGYNNYGGSLGDGTTINRYTPVQVGPGYLTNVSEISAGLFHSLALKSDGTVWAWGYNYWGHLGDGTNTDRYTPVQVKGVGGEGYLTNIIKIAAGYNHSLVLKDGGTVYGFGSNFFGELGRDDGVNLYYTPIQVKGVGGSGYLTGIVDIAAGYAFSIALKSDGTVYAWGLGGKLGDGTSTMRFTPVQVKGVGGSGYLTGITSISSKYEHTLALGGDGSVYAWGRGNHGELGDGTLENRYSPVKVKGVGGVGYLSNIIGVAAGDWHSRALQNDGTTFGWGRNASGQLGDGTTIDKTTPIITRDLE